MDAAKNSEYFDTNRAFFNDVTHRKSNNRVQPWVQKATLDSTKKHIRAYNTHSHSDSVSDNSSSILNSGFSDSVSQISMMSVRGMNQNQYNLCNGTTRLVSSNTQKVILKEYYTTKIDLSERVCFTHLRQPDYLTLI